MHRALVLLAVVTGAGVGATLARPGETPSDDRPQRSGPCASAAELDDFLRTMLSDAGHPDLVGAAVAAEGAEEDGAIQLEGQSWGVDLKGLRGVLGTPRVYLQNALLASALAAPGLASGVRQVLCEGVAKPETPMVVVGAETVLGGAFMIPDRTGGWIASPSKGALVAPRPIGEREVAVAAALRETGWQSLEQIGSRRGLVQLYAVIRRLDGLEPDPAGSDPLGVGRLVLAGDPHAREAMAVFSGWIGSFARYLAMMGAARGGVFVSSPFVRELGPAFDRAAFAGRFRRAGAPGEDYLARIPAYQVTMSMALLGLSTLFSPSDARFGGETAVHLLDC